jgi:hypothetical protein
MYDDFWAGYNSGNGLTVEKPFSSEAAKQVKEGMGQDAGRPGLDLNKFAGTYDKSKVINMNGPNGEKAEIYANGKMYIIFPTGKKQARTFPSRPWGIRYMQKRGWVLV